MNFQFHTNSTQHTTPSPTPTQSTTSQQQQSSSNSSHNNTLVMLTKSFANTIVTELKKQDNFSDFTTYLVDPVINHIFKKLYPYIMISSAVFLLTFITAVVILVMMLRSQHKHSGGSSGANIISNIAKSASNIILNTTGN
jgi:hypothetical protein